MFVQSSTSEGLSNTILEAMASALPVVATRVGGADEMVQDGLTGLLVPPSSAGDLAAAMATLLADPTRARALGESGRGRVESEFSLEAMIRRYEELYVELVQASRVPAAPREVVPSDITRSGVA
jgi:glycosyltransferase involved in cell wall biosynthesis